MKERPIIFTTNMVRSILDGRKTQTRRIIKARDQPYLETEIDEVAFSPVNGWCVRRPFITQESMTCYEVTQTFKCPYGQPGDILYVKETFRKYNHITQEGGLLGESVLEYKADGHGALVEHDGDGCIIYKKNGEEKLISWTSPRFMPKEAARTWLQVTDIRVERVQDISEEDAMAEGVEKYHNTDWYKRYGSDDHWCATAYASYAYLFETINGKDAWNANPWVWVITFRVLSTTGRPAKFPALCEAI